METAHRASTPVASNSFAQFFDSEQEYSLPQAEAARGSVGAPLVYCQRYEEVCEPEFGVDDSLREAACPNSFAQFFDSEQEYRLSQAEAARGSVGALLVYCQRYEEVFEPEFGVGDGLRDAACPNKFEPTNRTGRTDKQDLANR